MRILIDEHLLDRDRAFDLTTRCLAYTNHTVLPEALEKWDVEMFASLLPRHLEIIYDINQRFLDHLRAEGFDEDVIRRVSIIEEGPQRKVRMANLACVGSRAVNGVAELHTAIIKQRVFEDFHRIWPTKISQQNQRHHSSPVDERGERSAFASDRRPHRRRLAKESGRNPGLRRIRGRP